MKAVERILLLADGLSGLHPALPAEPFGPPILYICAVIPHEGAMK